MLVIDRLRISLPPGFEHRAESVARLVAAELAALPVAGRRRVERLEVPAVEVAAGDGDRHLAGRLATAIHHQLRQTSGGAP